MATGNVKPRTIQADDDTWEAFQNLAWKRRLSASKLFREWVTERKIREPKQVPLQEQSGAQL